MPVATVMRWQAAKTQRSGSIRRQMREVSCTMRIWTKQNRLLTVFRRAPRTASADGRERQGRNMQLRPDRIIYRQDRHDVGTVGCGGVQQVHGTRHKRSQE